MEETFQVTRLKKDSINIVKMIIFSLLVWSPLYLHPARKHWSVNTQTDSYMLAYLCALARFSFLIKYLTAREDSVVEDIIRSFRARNDLKMVKDSFEEAEASS